MTHIEKHSVLERHLYFLRVFDKEAEREDGEDAVAEVVAAAHALRVVAVDQPANDEEHEIGQSLVQLSRVAGDVVHLVENEGPGHIRWLADNLRVHEVAHADGGSTQRCHDADVIPHGEEGNFHPP